MGAENADFSGYATKVGLKCSDGRTIMPDAFAHQDKMTVPLVWQHSHDDPKNVLGHAVLENRKDGVYAHAFFNSTPDAQHAKTLVQHGDIVSLSIYANQLKERSKQVFHGMIRELSLVLSGANPGALIDQVRLAHSDGTIDVLEDEAIIYTGLELEHSDLGSTDDESKDDEVKHEDAAGSASTDNKSEDKTLAEVLDSLTPEQRDAVNFVVGAAIEEAKAETVQHSDESDSTTSEDAASDDETNNEGDLNHQEGTDEMSRNVFDQNATKADGPVLSHADVQAIQANAIKMGSLKEAVLAHAAEYGIEDIDLLFPDAKSVTSQPDLIARRTEWVKAVLDGAKHSPFARIKSTAADLTADEARAKGYVKGNLKKEEVIKLLKRVTTPTTVYKKQKLDRDDIIDITDMDVVAWLKWEMRFMLEEELARAILVGDGREPDDDDKIDEDKLRPIAWDDDMYAHGVNVPAEISPEGIVESVLRARKFYKGTGTPSFFTTDDILTDMILLKDKVGRRLYNTEVELAAALRVDKIVVVEVMENTPDLLGVIVNMADYTIGADKGGQLSMFDDFDIDYNQYKYLIETRISGALTKPKSAVVIKRTSGTTVTPTVPSYNSTTHVLTIPTVAGVKYFDVTNPLAETELTAGNKTLTATTDVEARPNAGYNFPHNTDADWTFAFSA